MSNINKTRYRRNIFHDVQDRKLHYLLSLYDKMLQERYIQVYSSNRQVCKIYKQLQSSQSQMEQKMTHVERGTSVKDRRPGFWL